eukprot:3156126-Prymnesium_polylepis.1
MACVYATTLVWQVMDSPPPEDGMCDAAPYVAQSAEEAKKRAESAKVQAAEFKAKRAELMGKQRQWLEEE